MNTAIPCTECTANCCGEFRIFITPFDLLRLSKALNVPAGKICLPVQLCLENADHRPSSFSLGEEERFLLALRRRSDRCLFQMNVGGMRRCGVHAFRPLVCRSYPFIFDGRRLRTVRQFVCPTEWTLTPEERVESISIGKRMSAENMQYEALLETWHEVELPRINREGIASRAFRERFHRYLIFLENRCQLLR
ncbi:MAG: YkgJ family cysteine cluster protein [Candidatus Riflebacteria bacterium]|nr:YkgJ family cysteine cluster protein [Candidatus Riflebacteria bacterium]